MSDVLGAARSRALGEAALEQARTTEALAALVTALLLALLYFALGKLGLMLAVVNPSATAVWPPTGLALAALLVFGYRFWPAILVGAFLVNITTSGSLPASLGIAVGNSLEALTGAYLINRYAEGRRVFERAHSIFRFIVLAGLLCTTVSATIGAFSLALNGLAQWSEVARVWLTWWLGDVAGALILTPVLILWANYIRDRSRAQVLETVLLMLSMLVVALIAFSDLSPLSVEHYPVYFLMLPIVVWFAFRLSAPETATAILILSGIALSATLTGSGPFSKYSFNDALLLLQTYMSIVAMIFLSLAAVVAERKRMEQALASSELKYNTVVEMGHDAIVTFNEHGEILYINAVAERIFGYRVSEMMGQNLAILIPEYAQSLRWRSARNDQAAERKPIPLQRIVVFGRHKDGREIPLQISFSEYLQGGMHLVTGVVRDITERYQADESRNWLATLVESSGDAVIGATLDGVVLSWNKGAEKTYGYAAGEIIGRSVSILLPAERIDEMRDIFSRIRGGESLQRFETVRMHKDGTRIHVSLTITPIRDLTGAVRGASIVARDITESKRAEETLRHSQSFLSQAQKIGGIGSWISSLGPDKSLWWSQETYKIFGIDEDTPIDNETFFAAVHPDDLAAIQQAVQHAIETRLPYSVDHRIRRPDGSECWVSERAEVTFDDANRPVNLIGVVQDINDRKRTEEDIYRFAYTDVLTELPNRTYLFQRLRKAIDEVAATGQTLALLFINIKGFRDINDTLGHESGDRVLIEVAARLRRVLWDSDTVARLASDEFAVLLPRLGKSDDIDSVVAKILKALNRLILIADVPLELRSAIGIALYPQHAADAGTLFQYADVALNAAKNRHEAYLIYDPVFDCYDPLRLSLMAELREAIGENQLRLHYQPRVDLRSRKIVGVEALLRWQHPKRGLIAPDQFIPAAEKTGLVDDLTKWVLAAALAQAKRWYASGIDLEVSVNVSAQSLREGFLSCLIQNLLVEHNFSSRLLVLEVTESAIMIDPVAALHELEAVHRLGVRIAIDDFGIGYSSLVYLRQLPVSQLKIDKSFVIEMHNPKNAAIVRGTIELAHSLGLGVTAEGVEDKTKYSELKLLGCDQVQGFYITRPLPADEFEVWRSNAKWRCSKAASAD